MRINNPALTAQVMVSAALLFLLTGFWVQWTQERYRMVAEELIKDKKMRADAASRCLVSSLS